MSKLEILAKPCGSATCPTIYKDADGRLFLQGSKLVPTARQEIAVAEHEEVVEIDASLFEFLRTV